jgi:hypothetical protein
VLKIDEKDMNWIIFIIILAAVSLLILKRRKAQQLAYIRSYLFHKSIKDRISDKHPQLNAEQVHLVFRALRDYFWMCNKANKKMVAMPSQVVDDAWHEFILFTRSYKGFCQRALGRFLHHTPTEAMSTPTLAQEGIKRAWRLACDKEGIDPANPARLPLIFAIDSMLDIANGFKYVLNCQDKNSPNYRDGYCAGHIGCSSGCSGDSAADTGSGSSGFFDGFFDSSCGSDCGGGCGGD